MRIPGGAGSQESTCQCRRRNRREFDPWVGKIPRKRAWHPTPVLFTGESHGQRSLVGCSPWGRKRVRYDLANKEQQTEPPQFMPIGCGGRAILNDWLMSRIKGMIPRTSYDTHKWPWDPLHWLLRAVLTKHHGPRSLLSHRSGEQKSKART